MDALIMCGGPGRRLGAGEKPLFEVGGRPMVDRVADALTASRLETTYAVVSPHVPSTRDHLELPHIDTPGDGYVADLRRALADARIEPPVLTVAADLPLLSASCVDWVLARHGHGSTAVCVPVELKRHLGVSVGPPWRVPDRGTVPAGVNVVADAGAEATVTSYDARLAVNVNHPGDAAVAEALA